MSQAPAPVLRVQQVFEDRHGTAAPRCRAGVAGVGGWNGLDGGVGGGSFLYPMYNMNIIEYLCLVKSDLRW